MNRPVLSVLALGALLAPVTTAGAQGAAVAGGVSAYYEQYDLLNTEALGINRLTLLTIPVGARVEVLRGLWFDVATAYATASLRRDDGTESTVSGPTDTQLQLSQAFLGDRVVVGAAYVAPTGVAVFSEEEAAVAGVIAADLLPTRISSWGSGGGLRLSTAASFGSGRSRLGAGAGYAVASSLEPLRDSDFVYRPGNELHLYVSAEHGFGGQTVARVRAGTRQYSGDRIGGENLYQTGARYETIASLAWGAGDDALALLYGGVLHRGVGTVSAAFGDTASQTVLVAGGGLRIATPGGWTLVPTADTRLVRRSDGLNQGRLSSVGAEAELPLGPLTFVPSLRARFGKALPWSGAAASVRGTELQIALRYSTGRRE
jgi:hypothetical protein